MIPGLGRSPREGNGNPHQYSSLGNPMDGEPGGLQSMGSQELDTTERLNQHHERLSRVEKCSGDTQLPPTKSGEEYFRHREENMACLEAEQIMESLSN